MSLTRETSRADRPSLAESLTTAPRPADPDLAARRLRDWQAGVPADHALRALLALPGVHALLLGIADHSPYLWRLATVDPDRLAALLSRPAWLSFDEALDAMTAGCAGVLRAEDTMVPLRRGKMTVALLLGLADLAGAWTLDEVMEAMTVFADRAVVGAVDALLRDSVVTGKLVAAEGAPGRGSGLAVLAMGKGGAGELNYSSDIDLVIFYDPAAPRLASDTVPPPFYVRLAKGLVRLLGERTGDGYVLRIDLRLRPDPASTGVAVSLPSAFAYYEALGQNWERAAYIKARPVAGDLALGAAFLTDLAPFIWRRYFDYAAVADIHAMKRQIHAFKGHASVAVAGHDVKVGRGGIREIEFFVQTQQLIFGGRRPTLRGARTLDTLARLAEDGWIDAAAAEELARAYRLLRKVEHRLQMVDDEQTQRLPTDERGLDRLALFAGFPDRIAFETALMSELRTVEAHYARLFEHAPGLDAAAGSLVFSGDTLDAETVETLGRMGFLRAREAVETIRGWHFGRRPATRGARAREILTELVPDLIEAFSQSGDPDAALAGFDAALGRLPAATELFSILRSNAALRELYADMLGVAPRLAATVAMRPHLLDAAIDPALQRDALPGEIEVRIAARTGTTEEVLDRTRDVAREESFLIGLRLLAGSVAPSRAGEAYSDLAGAILRALLERTEADFAADHGRIAGGALAVVAMGKFGSREMTASSDLDLLVIYDADPDGPDSDGPRPLAPSRYYTRLAQRLIGALTVPTRRGPLYEVDMRLRPSGNQGPLATRFSGFVQYQAGEAETWERMALTRARVVAGDASLGTRIGGAIRAALTRPSEPTLGRQIRDLRALVAAGKPYAGSWDLKLMPGGQIDVEFLAQFLVLRHAKDHPDLLGLSTARVFAAAHHRGLLAPDPADLLTGAATLYTDLSQMIRLAVDGIFDGARAGVGLKRRLARAVALPDHASLQRHLAETAETVRANFDAILSAQD
ncbi:MAG: bifunctional [glutamine synthetase] adenylyltransferase/[glutamine synthetase]-adenylyl-L-tyrosine phosphorylase [Janthinobacterium lividum]